MSSSPSLETVAWMIGQDEGFDTLNARLDAFSQEGAEEAAAEHARTKKPSRVFTEFPYRTRDSWSAERRVVAKAEQLEGKKNPRFVVTSLPNRHFEKRFVYEGLYCARGEMENRIKEEQLGLFGDRASCHTFRGNEIRIWLSATAHLLIVGLRTLGLHDTELARAQASTIRIKLFKVGAQVTVSVRRVYVQMSSAYPLKELFRTIARRLRGPPAFATN